MKTIPLVNIEGTVVDYAIIDDEDFERVAAFSWSKTTEGYVNGTINNSPIRLHQFLIGRAPKGLIIAHKNGNKLDNRKINLRYCTKSQNGQNIAKKENTSSQYKGVSKKGLFKWTVTLRQVNNVTLILSSKLYGCIIWIGD